MAWFKPLCPNCGRPLALTRAIERADGRCDLLVYECRICRVTLTEASDGRSEVEPQPTADEVRYRTPSARSHPPLK